MKFGQILRNIAIRAVAFAVLAALTLSGIFYALGYFELPYIERPDEPEETKDLHNIEESIKALETGSNVSGIGADSSEGSSSPSLTEGPADDTSATVTDSGSTDTQSGDKPSAPDYRSYADLLKAGYSLDYGKWSSAFELGLISTDNELPSTLSEGNTKHFTEVKEIRYEEEGLQFASCVDSSAQRDSVELYMGYILVDSGTGIAEYPVPDSSGIRRTVGNCQTLSIYSSSGKLIGTYPADSIVPAYTRDNDDNALFILDNKYYYLDGKGNFTESDYIDERDNRGLYFDYSPAYGRSDCYVKKYANNETITLSYVIDTYYYYARFSVDWRIARELYEKYPEYAEKLAQVLPSGKYVNRLFYIYLAKAKQDIAYDIEHGITSEVETEPVTEPVDSGAVDSGAVDSGAVDSGAVDSGAVDSGAVDSGAVDSGAVDSGAVDSGAVDSGAVDSGAVDSGAVDSGAVDSGAVDSGAVDSGTVDSGAVDSGAVDSGAVDSGAVDSGAVSEEITTDEKDTHEIIEIQKKYNAWRFIYATKQPEVNTEYHSTLSTHISVYQEQEYSWDSQYKYAKAFNFSEGRAVTFDDNGYMRIINTYGGTAVYKYVNYLDEAIKEYVNQSYIEPFFKDKSSIGHYYYDEGLLRVRFVERYTWLTTIYTSDKDILIDTYGNEFEIPAGFTLCSYSDGVLILERDGLYGCYHKDGYWIAQPVYSGAEPFIEGLCVLTLSDGTEGMIDTNGNVILPFRYTRISNASTAVIAAYNETEGWTIYGKMTK